MSKVSLGAIFGSYAGVLRRYWGSGLSVALLYACGLIISEIFLKLSYRDLFDIIAVSDVTEEVWSTALRALLLIIAFVFTYNTLWRVADFIVVHHQSNVLRELMNESLEKLQRHSYNFFVGSFTGSLVAKVRRYVNAFETLEDKILFNFWWNSIQIVCTIIVLGMEVPAVALFFVGWCVVHFVSTFFFVRYRRKFDLYAAQQDSNVTGEMSDSITNILNVKMFTSGDIEKKRFHGATQRRQDAQQKTWYMDQIHKASMSLTMAILEFVGMYIALRIWKSGEISAGTVILVQMLFYSIMMSTWDIGRAMRDFFRALADATEMVEIMQTPIGVQDAPAPEDCKIQDGEIDFRNVYFSYENSTNVFSDFSLHIPKGQRVGIVGHSGGGKSTLFKLLLRFLDVTDGSIAIDSQDIRAITQDDLRRRISYVPQDPVLFHRSLYENISYANQDANEEEIINAAKRAHAYDFIENLPNGFRTLVGERGIKLSGGERQRIAIARAILKDAPVLLLDEATSSLDSVSEKYIQEQLQTLMQNCTTLAIAHRISTINQMDRIIVIEHGNIVEDGSHDQLLKKNGVYADLWKHQSAGFLVEE